MASTLERLRVSIREHQDKKETLEGLMKEAKGDLELIQKDIEKGIDKIYKVYKHVVETVPTGPGQYITNCTKCNTTCHERCGENGGEISKCYAMDGKGRCRICPQRCDWSKHKRETLVYVIKLYSERKAVKNLNIHRNFTYTYDEGTTEVEPTKPGQYTTNCVKCHMTCHDNCPYYDDNDKSKCRVMDKTGRCEICPQKCHWTKHQNQPYIYVDRTIRATKTADDLKRKYEEKLTEAENKIDHCKKALEKVNNEIDGCENELVSNFD